MATDADQRVHLDQVLRTWAGRPDIRLVVKPIRDYAAETHCNDHAIRRQTYAPSTRDREAVELENPTCVHPHCTRPARLCDCDHITPFDPHDPDAGGVTCPNCNLAPLCRHHHRLKTLAGWRYWKLGPATYLWTDPHGLLYLRTRDGTRSLT